MFPYCIERSIYSAPGFIGRSCFYGRHEPSVIVFQHNRSCNRSNGCPLDDVRRSVDMTSRLWRPSSRSTLSYEIDGGTVALVRECRSRRLWRRTDGAVCRRGGAEEKLWGRRRTGWLMFPTLAGLIKLPMLPMLPMLPTPFRPLLRLLRPYSKE